MTYSTLVHGTCKIEICDRRLVCPGGRTGDPSVVARDVDSAKDLDAAVDHAFDDRFVGDRAGVELDLCIKTVTLDQCHCLLQRLPPQVDQEQLLAAIQGKQTCSSLSNSCEIESAKKVLRAYEDRKMGEPEAAPVIKTTAPSNSVVLGLSA